MIEVSDNEVTGATARPWRFVPSHVAEGPSEVRSPEGWLICTTSSDADAALIERAVNAYEPLKARLAEVERELERTQFARDAAGFIGTAAECIEFLNAQNLTAEARVAVLERALESIRQYGSDTLSGRADGGSDDRQWQREAVREMTQRARTTLAAEQDTPQ